MVSTSLSSVKSSSNSLASFLAYVFVRLSMTHVHLIFILEGDLNQQQFALFSMIWPNSWDGKNSLPNLAAIIRK